MSGSQLGTLPQLLLIEPDRIVRSTVAGVCRGLDLAQVHQAASVSVGLQTLQSQAMDALLISMADQDAAMALNQIDFLQANIGDSRFYRTCKAMFTCDTPLASDAGMEGLVEGNSVKARFETTDQLAPPEAASDSV